LRQANAARYLKLLEGVPVLLPSVAPYQTRHVFNQFTIRCARRDELKVYLAEHGIGTEIYYPLPLHLQNCFSELGYQKGDLPVSEQIATEALSLPVHPELSEDDQVYVAETIRAFYAK